MAEIKNRLAFAKSLAEEAAAQAVRLRDERGAEFIAEKGPQDFVTFADRAVEGLIRQRISESWPSDAMLGEEDGVTGSGSALGVVDPKDGAANFMRGHRDWGVCIAFYDGERLSVSDCAEPDRALLMLGWSNRRPLQSIQI